MTSKSYIRLPLNNLSLGSIKFGILNSSKGLSSKDLS